MLTLCAAVRKGCPQSVVRGIGLFCSLRSGHSPQSSFRAAGLGRKLGLPSVRPPLLATGQMIASSVGAAPPRPAVAAHRIYAPRTKHIAARASSALLERPPQVDVADVLVPPPSYDVDLLHSFNNSAGFQEYDYATARLVDLERLSAELLENLKELNSASDALEAMPTPDFFQLHHQEARRAKRAAAREARKTQATVQQPTAQQVLDKKKGREAVPEKPKSTSSSPMQPSNMAASLPSSMAASLPSSMAASLPSSMAASLPAQATAAYERLGQTRSLTAGPSIISGPSIMSGSSLMSGPSLLAKTRKPVGKGMQAEPSTWAREANAKRAGVQGTRRTAAAMQQATKGPSQDGGGATDGTSIFMKRSGNHDLLNGASEKDLANIVKDALFVERVKEELKDVLKREPTMSEWARALGMDTSTFSVRLDAGQHAKSVMLQANYRLVIAICKKYQHKGMALQDLITEGIRGLLTGVEKFDADKGFRFSTYAHWWIRQAVMRSISAQGREVRLPAHIAELLTRIKYAQSQLKEQLSREASVEEVAQLVQLSPSRVNEIIAMAWNAGSLDSLIGSEEAGGTMKDRLQDARPTPDENLKDVMFGREMDSILSSLSEREAGVIRLRFGLDGEQVVTLEEIGLRLNLTRERIRQIEGKAIRKLKQQQSAFADILQEHAAAQAEGELAARSSQGTNKSG